MDEETGVTSDGLDRLVTTRFPSTSKGAGVSSGGDYELLGLDQNGNVTSRRLRDGNYIYYGYDALNRLVSKNLPNIAPHEYDVTFAYDNLNNLKHASDSNGHFVNLGYDALGRRVSEQSNWTTRSWGYDAAGRNTRLTWGDGFFVTYEYFADGGMSVVRENGSSVLASFEYDSLGRRTRLNRANGTSTAYTYDGASRLGSLTQDLAGTAHDITRSFTYNAAAQIASLTTSNEAYNWTGHSNLSRSYATNGLNQYSSAGGVGFGYDGRGNLASSGADSYGYTSENKLATAPGGNVMTYDPLGRYHWIASGPVTWMQYDGDRIIEERYNNAVARRYVWGPGVDEPLVWYEGSGTGDKRWLHADERGSIVAVTGTAGQAMAINAYDPYGIPNNSDPRIFGRFGYTGQAWLPELGMYHYKARTYSPTLGRFLQPDPLGYEDGVNMYSYVRGDVINAKDPDGEAALLIGAAFGCLGGGAVSLAADWLDGKELLSLRSARSAGIGCAAGAISGGVGSLVRATGYLSRAVQNGTVGAVVGAAETATQSAADGKAVGGRDVAVGAASGFLGGGLGSFAGDRAFGGTGLIQAFSNGTYVVSSQGVTYTVAPASWTVAAALSNGTVATGTTVAVKVFDSATGKTKTIYLSPRPGDTKPGKEETKVKKK